MKHSSNDGPDARLSSTPELRRSRHVTVARCTLIGASALIAAILTACCSGSTKVDAEVNVPLIATVKWKFEHGSYTVDSNQPGRCFRLVWLDEEGRILAEETGQTDEEGSASGSVPKGAARWEFELVDCPDSGLSPSLFAARASHEYLFGGAPIVPSDQPGADNLVYWLHVRAGSADEASQLADLVLAGGIGVPVPGAVQVLSYAMMTPEPFGARLIQAQPGRFELWDLEVDGGAWRSDLSDTTRTTVGQWEVLELAIPASAFDYSPFLSARSWVAGSTRYKTDRMAAPGEARYAFGNRD